MKIFTRYISAVLLASAVATFAWDNEKFDGEYESLTLETYVTEVATAATDERREKTEIELEESQIRELKAEIAKVEAKIDATIKEKYTILGITEADVIAAEEELSTISSKLSLLRDLNENDLLARKGEFIECKEGLTALKDKPVSYLWRVRDQIVPVDRLLSQVEDAMPSLLAEYEVQLNRGKRDCLYRIAGQELVYEDVSKWPELYRANKSMIDRGYNRYTKYSDDPKYDRAQDLIFPGQVLSIPR